MLYINGLKKRGTTMRRLKKGVTRFSVCLVMLALISCSSIEGTRNKSYTYRTNPTGNKITTLAIAPIEDTSEFPFLSESIERELATSISREAPGIGLIGSGEFRKKLFDKDNIKIYTEWYTEYKTTRYLDFKRVKQFSDDLDVDYVLVIRSIHLDREKIRAVDTGYSGMVSDANNVWRTKLKFIGELFDLENNSIAWQGIGYSENINSPKRGTDLFFVILEEKNPEVEEYLSEMVVSAVNGMATEMIDRNK
jgi:hypothetical protein